MRHEPAANHLGPTVRYRLGDLEVDLARAEVTKAGVPLALPKLSFEFLCALLESAPAIATTNRPLDRVWPGLVVSPETVSQRVKLLRDVLGDDPKSPVRARSARSWLSAGPDCRDPPAADIDGCAARGDVSSRHAPCDTRLADRIVAPRTHGANVLSGGADRGGVVRRT